MTCSSLNPPSQVVLHAYGTLVVSQFPQHRRGVVVDTGRRRIWWVVHAARRTRSPASDGVSTGVFRSGHAHAGVLVILTLVGQILIDATRLFGPLDQLA